MSLYYTSGGNSLMTLGGVSLIALMLGCISSSAISKNAYLNTLNIIIQNI